MDPLESLLALESTVAASGSLFGDALRERLPSAGPIVAAKFDLRAWLRALDDDTRSCTAPVAAVVHTSSDAAEPAASTPITAPAPSPAVTTDSDVSASDSDRISATDAPSASFSATRTCQRCGCGPCECDHALRKRRVSGYRNQAWKRLRSGPSLAAVSAPTYSPTQSQRQFSEDLESAYLEDFAAACGDSPAAIDAVRV